MIFRNFLVSFCCLFCFCLCAQNEYVEGILVDATTEEPIVFATIQLKNRSVGVVSDRNGGFRIPERFKTLGDTLVVSSMGYENLEVPISVLSQDTTNRLSLSPAVFVLNEAVVRGRRKRKISASKIVQKAVDAIPTNYPVKPFSLVGYYRDYQWDSKEYVNLNEAIIEIFDQGFQRVDSATTETLIYDYRENDTFRQDAYARQKYDYTTGQKVIDKMQLRDFSGNEFRLLRIHDAIRNYKINTYDFVNRLTTDFISNHQFSKQESIYFEDRSLYVIKSTYTSEGYLGRGLLYISPEDFSIHKMEYAVYDNEKRNDSGEPNKYGIDKRLIFETVSEYRKKSGKMFLNYISFNNYFLLRDPPKFVVEEVTVDLAERCFVVRFNEEPKEEDALSRNRYDVAFDGKKIGLEKVRLKEDEFYLYPKADKTVDDMFAALSASPAARNKLMKLISVESRKLEDIHGNVLNEWTTKEINQFREFFVQEVNPSTLMPEDARVMNKNRPIFQNQPIAEGDNIDDYWMNTPLK